jgi:hypothetical protein
MPNKKLHFINKPIHLRNKTDHFIYKKTQILIFI